MAPPRFVTATLRAAAAGGLALAFPLLGASGATADKPLEPPGQVKKQLQAIEQQAAGVADQPPSPPRDLKLGADAKAKRTHPHAPGGKKGPAVETPAAASPQPVADAAPAGTAAATAPSAPQTSRRSRARRRSAQGGTDARRPSRRGRPRARTLVRPAVSRPARTAVRSASERTAKPRDHASPRPDPRPRGRSVIARTAREIVKVVPGPVKAVLAAMAALIAMLAVAYLLAAARGRRLGEQRGALLQEVGLLQAALLPDVPDRIGLLQTSVAYKPAEGPGAGGDFYDAFPLDGGRVGIVVGDVAGHGRTALAQTALLRYTLRVYLETGLDPRTALRLAGRTLDEDVGAGFATAVVASYDPGEGTLTYACAGHPPPVLIGPPAHEPVVVGSSPPIGMGARTGHRQTTVPFSPNGVACFFTDGLTEARIAPGLLGRERLTELLGGLGPDASAAELLERIGRQVRGPSDDMAACIVRPRAESFAPVVRIEELEVDLGEEVEPVVHRFLAACDVDGRELPALVGQAASIASRWGGVLVRVRVTPSGAETAVFAPHVNALEAAALG